jgi:hypothetical protein
LENNTQQPPAPAPLVVRFAPLTVAGLPVVRGGYVWDEAQRRNVWRDEAVTVVMFDKIESGGMKA